MISVITVVAIVPRVPVVPVIAMISIIARVPVVAMIAVVTMISVVAYSGACRAVAVTMAVAIVSAVPAVAHSEVCTISSAVEVVTVSVIVTVSSVTMPGMSSAIGGIEVWPTEVEVVAVGIACIDGEVPETGAPVERTVEVTGCTEGSPLPVEEDVADVEVTALPIDAIDIVNTCYSHQVVEIDFIGGLILLIGQIEFVCHLIGEEEGLIASLFVAHRVGGSCGHDQHYYQGYHLFHNRNILKI